jgi:NAD(P)-dependent dehydrogenase (short-subunit alcohol dehydrogenase family)
MSEMRGRVVVVTGSTTGIGKETARQLAAMGAQIVVVGRDDAKIAATVSELGGTTLSIRCDFARLSSVREAAIVLRERHPEIHVLVNNAGAAYMERGVTADALETSLQVNHLAPFLFTRILMPSIERAARADRVARIVNVASAVHAGVSIDWDDLQSTRDYAGLRTYARTKLMNVMFTHDLARRLESKHVTANSLHPGVVASGFGHNNRGWMGFGVKVVAPFLTTPEKGARSSVFLASSPEVEHITGEYFDERSRRVPPSAESLDVSAQEKLWSISEALIAERVSLDS